MKIALVGCGRISDRHIQVLSAIPEVQIVGVCDIVAEKAAIAAKKTGAQAYTDAILMARELKPDIVTVMIESGLHGQMAMSLVPYVQSLVVEKPMTLTLDDADALIEACANRGVNLFVVKQNRFNPPVVRLRQALEQGRFGKLVMGTVRVRWCRKQDYYDQDPWRGTWKNDGGVLTNQASHHIDLLQWMMGPVASVQAYTARRLANIEAEDTGTAILRFTSGALGIVEATTATRPKDLEGSLSLLGEKASVVIGGFAVNKVETWNFADPLPEDADIKESTVNPPNVYGFGHFAFYKEVLDCIRNKRRPMLDGFEGRKSVELINAIYESATTGHEVKLRFMPKDAPLGKS